MQNKKIRFIGLIALTIFVVVGIVLVVYFVNKSSTYEMIEINKVVETSKCQLKVTNVQSEKIDDEYSMLIISIDIKAKKTIKFDDLKLSLSNGEYVSRDGFSEKIKKNSNTEFKISYKVKKYQEQFLLFDKYKIALGGAM